MLLVLFGGLLCRVVGVLMTALPAVERVNRGMARLVLYVSIVRIVCYRVACAGQIDMSEVRDLSLIHI